MWHIVSLFFSSDTTTDAHVGVPSPKRAQEVQWKNSNKKQRNNLRRTNALHDDDGHCWGHALTEGSFHLPIFLFNLPFLLHLCAIFPTEQHDTTSSSSTVASNNSTQNDSTAKQQQRWMTTALPNNNKDTTQHTTTLLCSLVVPRPPSKCMQSRGMILRQSALLLCAVSTTKALTRAGCIALFHGLVPSQFTCPSHGTSLPRVAGLSMLAMKQIQSTLSGHLCGWIATALRRFIRHRLVLMKKHFVTKSGSMWKELHVLTRVW